MSEKQEYPAVDLGDTKAKPAKRGKGPGQNKAPHDLDARRLQHERRVTGPAKYKAGR